ncbi:uncharacterized protein C8Q71DRAFT_798398 [Rhodofomes roseus]|uniref:BZIP domain-containing protein n=1 Tax=Rhodofomes roseus TaxID=34475 RepID=A0ABQ8K6G5_9APHY|nr:uncharacterized protein C8Q71DRAFT_798398 [Rhodofomes roseus]KAH9832840.1 hypothetical protein C8Q71DRAFT_798398 [Rhodofomes roseus]
MQLPATPSASRKRSRENETPSQRHKREKAAERQRRKRERDRQAGLNNILALSQVQQPTGAAPPPVEVPAPGGMPTSISEFAKSDDPTVEEIARRDRVRSAARERQRKHRALVKARKMRELGMDMGNEIIPGMEEMQYRVNAEGQYQPVMPHEMQPHPPHPQAIQEPPFPHGVPQLSGGQTFASTLLLSFSCAPLLKQHLLRTLNMTNDELTSLEPIIAQAWDHWDQQRRMHYAHHAANKAPDGSNPGDPNNAPPPPPPPYPMPFVPHDPSQPPPNDFRARFHRSLVAPSPFRSALVGVESQQQPVHPPPAPQPTAGTSASASASAPVQGPPPPPPGGDTINPAMSTNAPHPHPHPHSSEPPRQGPLTIVPGIDPQLGQARDEAAGVAGKLERS